MTVYIPTLSRPDMIEKIVPAWLDHDMPIRLVVERREYHMYNRLKKARGWGRNVYVLPLPLSGRGMGYARKFIVNHAKATNLEAIIISDDDHKPTNQSNMWELIDEAEQPGVLGVGGCRPLNDRNTGGFLSKHSGVILCPGGWGFTIYALNIKEALICGNFDDRLHTFGEDAELARQGISRGIPWRVHCDVWFTALNKRYAPGGFSASFSSVEARKKAERACMAIIHQRWPDYTNPPDKPLRVAWQRMLDRYIPNWREASALHGGSIDKLRTTI